MRGIGGTAFSDVAQRVEWLLRHDSFLIGEPNKKLIVTAMKRDGLISRKTIWYDMKLDKEIREAKIRWHRERAR